MPQWKSSANVAGMPKWSASIIQQGSGNANEASNNAALIGNTTPGTWKAHADTLQEVDGVFPVTPLNKANTTGEAAKVHGLGWAMRYAGLGPVITVVANNGSGFVTRERILLSNGSANGFAVITANATGNIASAVVVSGNAGLFPNTAVINETFVREKHVANLNFSNSTALTNVGNSNTINVTIANTNLAYGVTAFASFTSNTTGGISNTQTQAIAWASNSTVDWGLFSNTQTNTAVTIVFTNANGSVVGGTFTATANLVTSTGGNANVTALGGRAGRVTYEMLVIDRHIANGATGSFANTAQLPSN